MQHQNHALTAIFWHVADLTLGCNFLACHKIGSDIIMCISHCILIAVLLLQRSSTRIIYVLMAKAKARSLYTIFGTAMALYLN